MEDTAGHNTFLTTAKAAMTERFQVTGALQPMEALPDILISTSNYA